jgi:hypothetical protein
LGIEEEEKEEDEDEEEGGGGGGEEEELYAEYGKKPEFSLRFLMRQTRWKHWQYSCT